MNDAPFLEGRSSTEIKKKLSEAGRKYKQFYKVYNFPPNTTRTRYESGTADLTNTKAYRKYKNISKGLGAKDNDDIVVEYKDLNIPSEMVHHSTKPNELGLAMNERLEANDFVNPPLKKWLEVVK